MPTLVSQVPKEFSALYGQLSPRQRDELFLHLRQMVRQNQPKEQEKDDALERLIGCAKGAVDKPLTIEEMNEIAAAGWAGEL
ncbi:MAG: hypothetical protein IKX14_02730 [Neisseriaceae bacterium]|nr:hypothetical protein [Neisseriaceae bacterium]